MMAVKKILEQRPSEVEMLLPWHAAGALNARDARRVEHALARDPELVKQYAAVQQEYAEIIGLNESLGAPSARVMWQLFAAIDSEPARDPPVSLALSARIAGFFARFSPRVLAWFGCLGAPVLLLQAGVIGAMLVRDQQPVPFQMASRGEKESVARSAGVETPPRVLVRFAPDARVADVTTLLGSYHASIIDASGGLFRLQFGKRSMSRQEFAALIGRLQGEKIVNLAAVVPQSGL
ncbi:hypothetical protein [Bradyrhizobium sp. dw_78]|uniref:hypothetical protein n=1 Tax=Bradyrhizobium sp. dw_78 TaxID=2719793 RepID=UPI001BD66C0B|nr:hypothetical protein [Bradyrhizobium sp. dw_78]